MSVKAGRAAKVSFCLAKADDINDNLATVSAKTYLHIGATRGKTKTSSWTTADVTTSDSPQYNQQAIVLFKEKTLTVDGIAYDDAAFNLKALGSAIEFPDAIAQGGEPYMWLKYETPFWRELATCSALPLAGSAENRSIMGVHLASR